MRLAERRALRERYRFRCGYCGTTEVDAGGELTVDHFQPRSMGGADTPDNWVYACITCNDHKGDYWQPHSAQRILHPERDPIVEHIREGEDGEWIPLTEMGRFHLNRLRLNRPQLVAQRRRNGEWQRLREKVARVEEENAALRREMQVMGEQISLLLERIHPFR
jgi:hypothetical protein